MGWKERQEAARSRLDERYNRISWEDRKKAAQAAGATAPVRTVVEPTASVWDKQLTGRVSNAINPTASTDPLYDAAMQKAEEEQEGAKLGMPLGDYQTQARNALIKNAPHREAEMMKAYEDGSMFNTFDNELTKQMNDTKSGYLLNNFMSGAAGTMNVLVKAPAAAADIVMGGTRDWNNKDPQKNEWVNFDLMQEAMAEADTDGTPLPKVFGDLAQGAGQMATQLGVGTPTGLGSELMGVGVFGNEYAENRKDGMEVPNAAINAGMKAGSEYAMEKALGVLGKGAFKTVGKVAPKLVTNPAWTKFANSYPGKIVEGFTGEFAEEALQEPVNLLIDKMTGKAVSEEDIKNLPKNMLYSGLLGGLLGGGTTSLTAIPNIGLNRSIEETGKQFNNTETVQNVINKGLASDKKGDFYRVAENLKRKTDDNQDISDYEVGNLIYHADEQTKERLFNPMGENGEKQYNTQLRRRQSQTAENGAQDGDFDTEFGYYYKAGRNDVPFEKTPEYAGVRSMDDAARMAAWYSGQNDAKVEVETLGTEANTRRFRENVDKVFKGGIDTQESIEIGKTPQILQKYGADNLLLTINQSTMYKIAYPKGYFGTKKQGHNLGIPALKQLPNQIADPVAILKSNTQEGSLVILTQWQEENGNDVIIPIHLNKNGTLEIENQVASAYGTPSKAIFGVNENGDVDYSNILYTKNNEDIQTLLTDRLQLPVNENDDIFVNNSITQDSDTVKAEGTKNNASRRITKKQREFFAELSKLINTPIEIVPSIKSPGGKAANGAYVNGRILLAEDSDRPLIEVAKHEITHMLKKYAPKEYAAYEEYAIEALKKNGRYDDLFKEYAELYGTDNAEKIHEEIVADATQMFLTDEAAINELAQENPSLAQKFLDCIREFISRIKSLFSDGGIDEVTASFEMEQLKNAEKLWIKAVNAAKSDGTAEDGESKYQSRKNDRFGKSYWNIETEQDIFKGMSTLKELKKAAHDYILGGASGDFVEGTIDGETVVFNRIGANEYVYGRQSQELSKQSGASAYAKKMRIAPSIEDLIENADTTWHAPDAKNHKQFPNGFDNYRGRVGIDNTIFEYVVRVGNTVDNNVFYDLNLTPEQNKNGAELRGLGQKSTPHVKKASAPFDNSISQNGEKVNSDEGKDIKYQLRRQESLEKENEKLRAVNDSLRKQFYLTEGVKVNRKQIAAVAKKFLKDIHSTVDNEVFAERLTGIYDNLANSEYDNEAYAAAMFELEQAAREALMKSEVLDKTLYEQYADMREWIRNTAVTVDESVRGDFGSKEDWNDFRKSNFGRMKLVNDGLPMDVFYQELSEMYPEWFDEDVLTQSEQAMRIANVLDSIKPVYENPYYMDMDEMSSTAAYELFMEFFGMGDQTTFADRKQAQINNLKLKSKAKIASLRQEYKTRNRKAILAQRDMYQERIRKLIDERDKAKREDREKYQERINKLRTMKNARIDLERDRYKRYRENAKERKEVRKFKERIKKDWYYLSDRLLKPSDTKHIPEDMQEAVAQFLGIVDIRTNFKNKDGGDTKVTMKLNNLYQKLKKLEKNPECANVFEVMDADFFSDFEELTETLGTEEIAIRDMSSNQLEWISELLRSVKMAVQNANRSFTDDQNRSISDRAESAVADLKKKPPRKDTSKAKAIADLKKWTKNADMQMLDPLRFFRQMGETFEGIYQGLRAGLNKKIRLIEQTRKFMKDMKKQYGINMSTVSGKKAKQLEFKTESGAVLNVTKAEIMSLYLLNKREQARQHIYGGGIRLESKTEYVKGKDGKIIIQNRANSHPVAVTEIDVKKICDTLTAKEKGFADALGRYLSEDCSNWGNEISMLLHGYKKFKEGAYFPIKTDRNFLPEKFVDSDMGSIKNMGFTKQTNEFANNPIIVSDVFDVFTRHVNDMSTYYAFAAPMSDFQRIYNYNNKAEGINMKTEIENAHGDAAKEYIVEFIKAVNGMSVKGMTGALPSKLMANAKAAAVGWNLRVVVQQPTAIMRAADKIDPKYFVQNPKGISVKEMQEHSAIASYKSWGNYSLDMGRQIKEVITDDLSTAEKIKEAGMWAAGKADDVTWSVIWNAVKNEIADTRPELTQNTAEYWEAVEKRFDYVIDATQVVDSVFHRSALMRNKDGFWRMATSFMAEPTKSYNMMHEAIYNAAINGTKENKQRLARAVSVYVAATVVNSAIRSIIDAMRDDDEERKYWDKWLGYFMSGVLTEPLQMLPILRDIISLAQGYNVDRLDMSAVSDMISSVHKASKGNQTKGYSVFDIALNAANATGIGAKNIQRELNTVTKLVLDVAEKAGLDADWTEYIMMKAKFNINSSANRTKFYAKLYEAYDKGLEKGDVSTAKKILEDMVAHGIPKSNAISNLDTRDKKALSKNEELINIVETAQEDKEAAYEMLDEFEQNYGDRYGDKAITAAIKMIQKGITEVDYTPEDIYKKTQTDPEEAQKMYDTLIELGFYDREDLDAAIEAIKRRKAG